jgi:hypothetical protein
MYQPQPTAQSQVLSVGDRKPATQGLVIETDSCICFGTVILSILKSEKAHEFSHLTLIPLQKCPKEQKL